MERYEVRLCPAAVRDLEELVRRLDRLSPPAALRSYDGIAEQMRSLALMPERCPRPRDLALRARGYRCLRAEGCLVFFVLSGGEVQVRRVLHEKPEYAALL